MSTQIAPATIADLERHPGRCELINGEIVEMSPVGHDHGMSAGDVYSVLRAWARGKAFRVLVGDVGFHWSGGQVRAPDVAVITAEQSASAPRRGYLSFPPVLAVEVISPTDEWSEVKAKAHGWMTNGARLVWTVDPVSQTVDVFMDGRHVSELGKSDRLDGGSILPGFSCAVSEFFA
jgi:Uma2 family endonuclease